MPERTAVAHWEGPVKEGRGRITVESGAVAADYSFGARFEHQAGTNPEELLGAAHAGCFTMALALGLDRGGPPTGPHRHHGAGRDREGLEWVPHSPHRAAGRGRCLRARGGGLRPPDQVRRTTARCRGRSPAPTSTLKRSCSGSTFVMSRANHRRQQCGSSRCDPPDASGPEVQRPAGLVGQADPPAADRLPGCRLHLRRRLRHHRGARPARDLGPRLLPRRHLRVHRRCRRLGARGADRILGLVALDREGHPGAPHREHPRLDDDHGDGARADRHRAPTQRVRHAHVPDGRDPRALDRRRRARRRSVRRSAEASSSNTASTSRPPATARCGTSPRPTCCPASTTPDRPRTEEERSDDEARATLRRARAEPVARQPHPCRTCATGRWREWSPTASGASLRTPPSSPGRSRAPTPTTSSSARSSPRGAPCPTRTGSSSSPTSRTPARCCDRRSMPATATDGFVSIEVAPELARDTDATVTAARDLHERIALPNLFVKIPATAEGIPAIRAMIAEGRSINVTLIFSLHRYAEVIDAYLDGLEAFAARGGDLADGPQRRVVLRQPGRHRGRPAPRRHRRPTKRRRPARPRRDRAGQARLPTVSRAVRRRALGAPRRASARTCSDPSGRRPRPRTRPTPTRSTSTASSDPTPSTRCPRPPSPRSRTTARRPAPSTHDVDDARDVMRELAAVGIDMDDVGLTLEDEGVASFHESFQDVLGALDAKARQLDVR